MFSIRLKVMELLLSKLSLHHVSRINMQLKCAVKSCTSKYNFTMYVVYVFGQFLMSLNTKSIFSSLQNGTLSVRSLAMVMFKYTFKQLKVSLICSILIQ